MVTKGRFFWGIFVLFLLSFSFLKKDANFSPKKVQSSFSHAFAASIPPLNEEQKEEIRQVLSQEFHYLASGAECYCFCSQDRKYVLKFFKMKHLTPKWWLKYLSFPGLEKYRFRKYERRLLKGQTLFQNYKNAYENQREETGLIYLHLNKEKIFDINTKIIDRCQKIHYFNLNNFEFILQKKACLLGDYLQQLMSQNKKEGAVQAVRTFFDYIIKQARNGFGDQDSGIFHNYGFIGDQVIHFDIGRIEYSENNKQLENIQKEVIRVGNKLEKWMQIHQPGLLSDLRTIVDSYLLLFVSSPSPEKW